MMANCNLFLNNFLYMGGYAVYVWPTYGLVSLTLIGKYCFIHHQKKQIQNKLMNSKYPKSHE